MVIHGDDFTLLGYEESLDWFIEMVKKKVGYKHRGRLGPEDKDDKAIRILNRLVS